MSDGTNFKGSWGLEERRAEVVGKSSWEARWILAPPTPEAIGLRGGTAGEAMASGTAEFPSEQVAGKFRERLMQFPVRTPTIPESGPQTPSGAKG